MGLLQQLHVMALILETSGDTDCKARRDALAELELHIFTCFIAATQILVKILNQKSFLERILD